MTQIKEKNNDNQNVDSSNFKNGISFKKYKNNDNIQNKGISDNSKKNKNIQKNYKKSLKLGYLKKKIDRKKFFISHPKINFSDISINGKNCHNLNDIINKNLFKLRNKGKVNRSNFSKFTFISINDTKMQVQKMINKQ